MCVELKLSQVEASYIAIAQARCTKTRLASHISDACVINDQRVLQAALWRAEHRRKSTVPFDMHGLSDASTACNCSLIISLSRKV